MITSSGLDLWEIWRTVDRWYLWLGFVVYGAGIMVASFRWYLLLRHIRVPLSFPIVIRLTLIGQFFNLFVPGGVGGDLIKMVYLKKEAGNRVPEAVLSVLLDRVLGLGGLLLLGLFAVALNPSMLLHSSSEMQAILVVVALAGLAGLVGTLLFLFWPYLGGLVAKVPSLMERIPQKLTAILARVGDSFSLVRASPSMVGLFLLLAMAGHLLATFGVIAVGAGVGGVEGLTFQEFLLATQLSNLVGAVPLTPGGLGGRDFALAFLLQMSGATEEAKGAIPIVVTGLMISWSCLGGLALLWEKRVVPGDTQGLKE